MTIPGGWRVYRAEEAGAPELHVAGSWYFEPLDWDGDIFSDACPTREEAIELCREWVEREGVGA